MTSEERDNSAGEVPVARGAAAATSETPWVDAWIRWERNSFATYNDDEAAGEQADDELPPPTESYVFSYESKNGRKVDIELKGFHSDSEQIWNSTGLTLWKASDQMCEYLVENQMTLLHGPKRILELGTGLGRCGILAHKLLDSSDEGEAGSAIFLTDGDTDTLLQLRANVEHNICSKYQSQKSKTNLEISQLIWGTETAKKFLSQRASGQKFDVIFGSDLVYVVKVIVPLFQTVNELLLSDRESCFVMAHNNRRQGNEVDLDILLKASESAGFVHEGSVSEGDISVFVFKRSDIRNK